MSRDSPLDILFCHIQNNICSHKGSLKIGAQDKPHPKRKLFQAALRPLLNFFGRLSGGPQTVSEIFWGGRQTVSKPFRTAPTPLVIHKMEDTATETAHIILGLQHSSKYSRLFLRSFFGYCINVFCCAWASLSPYPHVMEPHFLPRIRLPEHSTQPPKQKSSCRPPRPQTRKGQELGEALAGAGYVRVRRASGLGAFGTSEPHLVEKP